MIIRIKRQEERFRFRNGMREKVLVLQGCIFSKLSRHVNATRDTQLKTISNNFSEKKNLTMKNLIMMIILSNKYVWKRLKEPSPNKARNARLAPNTRFFRE